MHVPANSSSREAWDAKLTELHEQLTASVEALINGDEWRQALEFAAHFRSRSFNNSLLIWAQHAAAYERGLVAAPLPTYVAGFKQWHTLSRRVSAGQKGFMIFAPVTARFASASPADSASWRRLQRSERPRAGEVVRTRMVGTRPAYVWDLSQTDGSPIPERPAPIVLSGEAPDGLWDGVEELIRGLGFTVVEPLDAGAIGGAIGMTDFINRSVSVRGDMDDAARAKTLVHELAHIRMHEPATDSLLHRGVAEVEAESVALMVGAAHGMDTSDYTIPYVSSWAASVAGKSITEVVQQTGERVRRVAVSILNQLSTVQVDGGDPPNLVRSNPVSSFPPIQTPELELQVPQPELRSL